MSGPIVLFSTRSYQSMRDEMAAEAGFEVGEVDVRFFPDGERYLRIRHDIDDREVALLGGTISDSDTLELYDLACGLVKSGAERLVLIIPYFGYSTMERSAKTGEVVTAKTRARLLSSIPIAPWGNRVILLDLHTEGLTHYFEGALVPVHVSARTIIEAAAARYGGDSYVLACTDAGRAKWVESLANELGVPASFVFKRRLSGARTEVTAVSAQVQGRSVVIYDDMIRTGGSLMNAARAYRDAGATRLTAIATHGIFPGDALDRIRETGLFERVVVTNSHPRASALSDSFLEVCSVGPLLAHHLRSLV